MNKKITIEDLKARGNRHNEVKCHIDDEDYQFLLKEALFTRKRVGTVAREILEAQIADLRDA